MNKFRDKTPSVCEYIEGQHGEEPDINEDPVDTNLHIVDASLGRPKFYGCFYKKQRKEGEVNG